MVSTAAHLWLNMPKLRSGDRLDSGIYNIAHESMVPSARRVCFTRTTPYGVG